MYFFRSICRQATVLHGVLLDVLRPPSVAHLRGCVHFPPPNANAHGAVRAAMLPAMRLRRTRAMPTPRPLSPPTPPSCLMRLIALIELIALCAAARDC